MKNKFMSCIKYIAHLFGYFLPYKIRKGLVKRCEAFLLSTSKRNICSTWNFLCNTSINTIYTARHIYFVIVSHPYRECYQYTSEVVK